MQSSNNYGSGGGGRGGRGGWRPKAPHNPEYQLNS